MGEVNLHPTCLPVPPHLCYITYLDHRGLDLNLSLSGSTFTQRGAWGQTQAYNGSDPTTGQQDLPDHLPGVTIVTGGLYGAPLTLTPWSMLLPVWD